MNANTSSRKGDIVNEQVLATGIVQQAISDWECICRKPVKPKTKDFALKIANRSARIKELRTFFKSGWCDMLIGETVRPEKILAQLEFMYEKSLSKRQIDAFERGEIG